MENLKDFTDNYSQRDFDEIKFDWNGKYGSDFLDKNEEFRLAVFNYIFPHISCVPLLLIRDLYLEFAKASEASYLAFHQLNALAEQLLIRGREKCKLTLFPISLRFEFSKIRTFFLCSLSSKRLISIFKVFPFAVCG